MEDGGRDKFVASHPAHCSYHVWVRCSVRYFHVFLSIFNYKHHSQPVDFTNTSIYRLRRGSHPCPGSDNTSRNISCCSVLCLMPVPFLLFDYYTTCFQILTKIIKMDVSGAFTEANSVDVDWKPHNFVGRIMCTDSICVCGQFHRLSCFNLHPSRNHHRIRGA